MNKALHSSVVNGYLYDSATILIFSTSAIFSKLYVITCTKNNRCNFLKKNNLSTTNITSFERIYSKIDFVDSTYTSLYYLSFIFISWDTIK